MWALMPYLLLAVKESVILVVVKGMIQIVDPTCFNWKLQILKGWKRDGDGVSSFFLKKSMTDNQSNTREIILNNNEQQKNIVFKLYNQY